MLNYNTLNNNLKRGILKFSEKICKNLKRPQFKLVAQMIYGILSSQSCHLSKIARVLDEKISLKKIIDRLSRNLAGFKEGNVLFNDYLKKIKKQINSKSILIVDESDITKKYATKMENIAMVRDGSSGEYQMGYHTLGVTALTPERKMPIPVYTRVYSSIEKDFLSADNEVLKALQFIGKHFSKKNIRAFDRGYDNNRYYEYLIANQEKFIIRAKKNRDVIYKDEKINIMELAEKFKGKYSLKFKNKGGLSVDCKISIIPVKLPCRSDDELNLVVCYGFGKLPMLLITNLKSEDKRISVAVVKVYLTRWRIEEYYRFKKQQFKFEDLRVQSINSIRNLDLMLTIALGYIGFISEKYEERAYVLQLVQISKRIKRVANFIFYAITDGLFLTFNKCKCGIYELLKKKPKPLQLCMFKESVFCWG